MRTLARAVSVVLFAAAASSVAAQPPLAPGGGGGNAIGATADFLLARTGELALTDAQVVRLAAISRRTEARRKAVMARMDSARAAARPAPGDSAGPRGRGRGFGGPPPADTKEMQQMRDQMHADVRDAIAVLTPDQQATAWTMIADRPALGRGGPPMGRRLSTGPGTPGDREEGGPGDEQQRLDRGPIGRPPAPRDVPQRPDGTERTEP